MRLGVWERLDTLVAVVVPVMVWERIWEWVEESEELREYVEEKVRESDKKVERVEEVVYDSVILREQVTECEKLNEELWRELKEKLWLLEYVCEADSEDVNDAERDIVELLEIERE